MADSLFIIPFGNTHRGEPIEDCPTNYLEWLLEQDWFLEKYPEGANAIGKELEFRLPGLVTEMNPRKTGIGIG
jgi:hypothetical protein